MKEEYKELEEQRDLLFNEISEIIKNLPQDKKDIFNCKILALIDTEIEMEKYCNQ